MNRSYRALILPLALLLATACAPLGPDSRECRKAVDNFAYILRWQRYDEGAALFADADQRRQFLSALLGRRDLQTVDVRVLTISADTLQRCDSAVLEMDYYVLPSVTLRTLRIEQTWELVTEGPQAARGLRIVTPFPTLP